MPAWVERFIMKGFQVFLSLARSLLTFFSCRPFLIISIHASLDCRLRKLPLTFKILHLLDQALSSMLSGLLNHCSLLSCRHSLMLFSFNLVLLFSAEILSSCLTFQVHLAIFTSFLSRLITSSSLTGQVSFPHNITLRTHAKQNLFFSAGYQRY